MVVAHEKLLLFIGLCDDAYEEVHQEDAYGDHDENSVWDREIARVVLYRLHVYIDGVSGGPHGTDPSFRTLEYEKCEETAAHRVIVEIRCEPFTAVIETVDLTLDVLESLS